MWGGVYTICATPPCCTSPSGFRPKQGGVEQGGGMVYERGFIVEQGLGKHHLETKNLKKPITLGLGNYLMLPGFFEAITSLVVSFISKPIGMDSLHSYKDTMLCVPRNIMMNKQKHLCGCKIRRPINYIHSKYKHIKYTV